MDESTPTISEAMNKNFLAKISIVASITEPRGTLMATSYNSSDAFWGYRDKIMKVIFEDKLALKKQKKNSSLMYLVNKMEV